MKTLVLVFAGGGLGSVVRFLFGKWVNTLHTLTFPFGTLAANVVACFVLGIVVGLVDHRQIFSADSRLFWAVGFCGGFSTFSTFSLESWQLIEQGAHLSSLGYVLASVVLCLVATIAGIFLAR